MTAANRSTFDADKKPITKFLLQKSGAKYSLKYPARKLTKQRIIIVILRLFMYIKTKITEYTQ